MKKKFHLMMSCSLLKNAFTRFHLFVHLVSIIIRMMKDETNVIDTKDSQKLTREAGVETCTAQSCLVEDILWSLL